MGSVGIERGCHDARAVVDRGSIRVGGVRVMVDLGALGGDQRGESVRTGRSAEKIQMDSCQCMPVGVALDASSLGWRLQSFQDHVVGEHRVAEASVDRKRGGCSGELFATPT